MQDLTRSVCVIDVARVVGVIARVTVDVEPGESVFWFFILLPTLINV